MLLGILVRALSLFRKFCTKLLKLVIIVKNLFLKFDFSFDKLILGQNIVIDKLLDLNVAVVVLVTFAEKLVDNLASVIFINAFLR